jgi:hypothetical protein
MGLSKAKSCLTFQLEQQQEEQEQQRQAEEEGYSYEYQQPITSQEPLERTCLQLPCGAPLYLPQRDSAPSLVDYHLSQIPKVASRAHELYRDDSSNHIMNMIDSSSNSNSSSPLHQTDRVLTVLQGEVAHASELQTDVLLSGEATTCHVVAVRSTSQLLQAAASSLPLTSLAHIDQCNPACLEKIVLEHIQHHQAEKPLETLGGSANANNNNIEEDNGFGFFDDDDEDDEEEDREEAYDSYPKESSYTGSSPSSLIQFPSFLRSGSLPSQLSHQPPPPQQQVPQPPPPPQQVQQHPILEMELHMVGGFLDKEGTSQQLSKDLLQSFADLSRKYSAKVQMKLTTAAISTLNTCSTTGAPKSRGLGIDTRTGHVFSVQQAIPPHLEGPALEVRNARMFSRSTSTSTTSTTTTSSSHYELAIIHDHKSQRGEIRIEPFHYQLLDAQLSPLLHIPDQLLLQVTSTSPDHESERFCSDLRRTLSFLQEVPSQDVFGQCGSRPLVYTRSVSVGGGTSSLCHNTNQWERQQSV